MKDQRHADADARPMSEYLLKDQVLPKGLASPLFCFLLVEMPVWLGLWKLSGREKAGLRRSCK